MIWGSCVSDGKAGPHVEASLGKTLNPGLLNSHWGCTSNYWSQDQINREQCIRKGIKKSKSNMQNFSRVFMPGWAEPGLPVRCKQMICCGVTTTAAVIFQGLCVYFQLNTNISIKLKCFRQLYEAQGCRALVCECFPNLCNIDGE